jgi:hypothetical protein
MKLTLLEIARKMSEVEEHLCRNTSLLLQREDRSEYLVFA